jgi:hypothetical protein
MDEMLLENEIELEDGFKISPDTFPGVIKQLFKLLKSFTSTNIYWGNTSGLESVYDNGYIATWGNDKIESQSNQYWNDLSVSDSGEVGVDNTVAINESYNEYTWENN